MITIGRYTFASEEDRKADYRRRVGPLRRPRTNTVERLKPEQTLAEWLAYIRSTQPMRCEVTLSQWKAYRWSTDGTLIV